MAERSPEEVDRENRWKTWVEAVFADIANAYGDPPSRGARRYFGEWQVEIRASGVGTAVLDVFSNAMKPVPQLHDSKEVLWERTTSGDAAQFVLDMIDELSRNPLYALMKRAMLP